MVYVRIDLSISDPVVVVAHLRSKRQGRLGQLVNRILNQSSDAIKLLESVSESNIEQSHSMLNHIKPILDELRKEEVSNVTQLADRVESVINQVKGVSKKYLKVLDQQERAKLQSKMEDFQSVLNDLAKS